MGVRRRNQFKRKPLVADLRSPDLSDARSRDRPSHREQLLEVARFALRELDLHYGLKQKKRARYSERDELDQAFARLSGEPLQGSGQQEQSRVSTHPILVTTITRATTNSGLNMLARSVA
jgi:hypothetical protein